MGPLMTPPTPFGRLTNADGGVGEPGCNFSYETLDGSQSNVFAKMYESGDTCGGGPELVLGTAYTYDAAHNNGTGAGCDGGEGHPDDGAQSSGAASGCANTSGSANSDTTSSGDSGVPKAGDPINTATGNKYIQETDVDAPVWLTFRRFYNSHPSAPSTAMGARWSHSFERSLSVLSNSNASSTAFASRPSGVRESFYRASGRWTASADNPDVLTEVDDANGAAIGYTLWIAALRHTETYSADGRLLTVSDSTGQVETLTYSDTLTDPAIAPKPNLLLTVTAPGGRALSFTYDSSSRIQKVTQPDGGALVYGYDAGGNLTSVQYPDGKTRQYVYNESGLTGGNNLPSAMTGIVDENGARFEDTGFDSAGRATSTQFAGGVSRVAIQYNADGSSDVTYPLGGVSHQTYTTVQGLLRVGTLDKPCGECNQPYASRTYDANSRPATYTDFNGNVLSYTFDSNGLQTQQIDAKGSADQRTVDTTWNTTLRVPLIRTIKDASGTIVQKQGWTYNATGQVTAQCLIDPVKAPSYTCAATGTAPSGVRRTTMTYCTTVSTTCPLLGLLLKVDGPRSDVTDTLTYAWYQQLDESGCSTLGGACHHPGDLKTATDGAGLVTTYVSYDKAGRPTRIKAPNGVLTDFTYTPRGWVATTTVRALAAGTPSSSDATTTINYNPDGTVHSVTDPDNVATTYTYDAAHRLTDVTDGSGRRYHYTLDPAGNRIKEQVITAAGTVVKSTSKAFNTLGQLTSITDGLNRAVFSAAYSDSYDGNGNLVHSADGLGIQRQQVFDGLDRLVSTLRNYQGTDAATKNSQSVTSFDALDRVSGFSDPDGLNTTYDIDALNNVSATHSPDTGLTGRTYDVAGNPVTVTDATNNSRAMTYDADNRPLSVTFADTSLNIQYKFDEADTTTGCTGSFGKGHLTRVIEGNGGITWCYDAFGRVIKKSQTLGTTTRTTNYTWTRAGRLASLTTPNGTLVAYTRDTIGNVTSIKATPKNGVATTVVSSIVYKSFGPVASLKLGSGQTVTYTYDLTGAVTDVVGGPFALHLKRDAMGNITAIGNAAGVATPSETYSYDPLYRLTGVKTPTGTAIEAYSYNRTGDRLTKAAPGILTGAYNYASGTHHLTGVGTTTRVVDARGNTTSDVLASGTYGYGYNQRNRMTVVQNGGVTVGTYVLNALGQRIQKAASGVTTAFDYTEDSQLTGEASGTATRDYIWLGGIPVALVDGNGTTSTVSYVISDGLGTPRAVVDATGATKWQWAYASNPFGENVPTSGNGYVLNLRYAGQYFDAESGLVHNGFRDYEAATGRYLQSDPVGLAAGASTYGYANGSPMRRTDAAGLQSVGGPPEENVPENIPEVDEEIEELDREAREGIPPPGEATIPRPDAGEWGPNGECLRPDLRPPQENMSAGPQRPDFIVTPNGRVFPVPYGSTGPTPVPNGKGYEYSGGNGGPGFDPRVDTLRMMDPVTTGKYQYPNGYGVYQNSSQQGIDPLTGNTVPNNSPIRHIER